MSVPGQSDRRLIVCGVLGGIDLVSRELSLQCEVGRSIVYVPPACPIRLNGDSVRLRLTQPGDSAEISVIVTDFGWLAERIEIRRPAYVNAIASTLQIDSK
jgi:hypothetical protein